MKSDVLSRCGSLDRVKDLDARLITLEKEFLKKAEDANDYWKEQLKQANETFAAFPRQLQGLQLQIMRTETNQFDLSRQVKDFEEKLKSLERIDEGLKEVRASGKALAESELAPKLFAEYGLAPMHMVEHMKKDLDQALSNLKAQDSRIDYINAKFGDNQKLIR